MTVSRARVDAYPCIYLLPLKVFERRNNKRRRLSSATNSGSTHMQQLLLLHVGGLGLLDRQTTGKPSSAKC